MAAVSARLSSSLQLPRGRYHRGGDTPDQMGNLKPHTAPGSNLGATSSGVYGRSTPSLAPIGGHDVEKKLARQELTIASLRNHNKALEKTMRQKEQELYEAQQEAKRLWKKNKEKNYVTTRLKQEIDDRINKQKKIESLKNVLKWSDVGERHEVQNMLSSKVMQLDDATIRLESAEEKLRCKWRQPAAAANPTRDHPLQPWSPSLSSPPPPPLSSSSSKQWWRPPSTAPRSGQR
jgi:hypothetical protein